MEGAVDYRALDMALAAVFDEERECEHPAHKDSDKHAGTAQHYVHIRHSCGLDLVEAVCDVWRLWLDADILVMCRGCGAGVRSKQFVVSATGIGGGKG
jgi:hypothetical protein